MPPSILHVGDVIDAAGRERRGALIGYLPVGFPDLDTSVAAAVAMLRSGVDALEFGLPYSDPIMDGPVIQAACHRALEAGFRVADAFEAIARVRAEVDAPVLVMGYWNLILQHGVERFAEDLRAAGGAGAITPDLVPDEAAAWIAASDAHDLDRIFLAAPTSTDDRLDRIVAASRGFVYTVSTLGTTGVRADVDHAAAVLARRLGEHGCTRRCVGIGISNGDQVREVLGYAEGAIVGSALVRALGRGGVELVAQTASDLAEGTRA